MGANLALTSYPKGSGVKRSRSAGEIVSLRLLLVNEPPRLVCGGWKTASGFCFVRDLVDDIIAVINRVERPVRTGGDVYRVFESAYKNRSQ